MRSRYHFLELNRRWKPSSKSCDLVLYDWQSHRHHHHHWLVGYWRRIFGLYILIWRRQMFNAKQHTRIFFNKEYEVARVPKRSVGLMVAKQLFFQWFGFFFPLWMGHFHWCHYHKCIFLHAHTVCANEEKNEMEYNQQSDIYANSGSFILAFVVFLFIQSRFGSYFWHHHRFKCTKSANRRGSMRYVCMEAPLRTLTLP